jgi:heat shock protein HtpX
MEKTAISSMSFVIRIGTPQTQTGELAEFLYQRLVLQGRTPAVNFGRTTQNDEHIFIFKLQDPQGRWSADVEMRIGRTVEVKMTPSSIAPPQRKVLDQLKDDTYMAVEMFEEQMRRRTVYFAWVEGVKMVPEKSFFKRRRMLDKILFQNMIFLFIILLIFSVFLFILLAPIFGDFVPFALVGAQFLIVLAAPRLIAHGSDWRVTEQNSNVHILMYTVPREESQLFRQKLSKDILFQMKMEIYKKTLALGKTIDCQTTQEVFAKYGITCLPEDIRVKTVNVYKLVKTVADRFGLPVPKIVISNTVIPNAAATGPGPRHGTILITSGILVQLEEDELLAVLGHEFSHLTGRDPLALFGLIAGEYLFRFYFILPILFGYDIFLFYIYFFAALLLIFFIAKFFEARADLVSAIRIGTPQILAGALRKIGFKRLGLEKAQSVRFQTWLGFDPHPPIYFRVDRLEKLQSPVEVSHPMLRSIRDCISGFFASF